MAREAPGQHLELAREPGGAASVQHAAAGVVAARRARARGEHGAVADRGHRQVALEERGDGRLQQRRLEVLAHARRVAAGQQHGVEAVRLDAGGDVGPGERRAIAGRLRHAVVVGHGVGLRAQHRRRAGPGRCRRSMRGSACAGAASGVAKTHAWPASVSTRQGTPASVGSKSSARQRDEDGGQDARPLRRPRTAAACRPGGSLRRTGGRRTRRRRACRARPRRRT